MPNADYYWSNVEKVRKNNAVYRRKNRDKIRRASKKRLKIKTNRDKAYAATKKWMKENPERMRAAGLKWREKNREKERVRSLKFRNDHIEDYRAYDRKYAKDNPDKAREKSSKRRTAKTKAGGSFTVAEWTALCKKHNNRCLCCGKKRRLTADHVIPVSKGGTSNISNIQPLCGPCNSSKRDKTIDYRRKPNAK